MKPIKSLYCCVCGRSTKGRQWFNRDNGFGLCVTCADRISIEEDKDEMKSYYGERGIHYDIKEDCQLNDDGCNECNEQEGEE